MYIKETKTQQQREQQARRIDALCRELNARDSWCFWDGEQHYVAERKMTRQEAIARSTERSFVTFKCLCAAGVYKL